MELGTIFIIVIVILSVILHEVAHGFAADFLGDPTARLAGRLSLNPIRHIDLVGSIIVPLVLSIIPGGVIFGWAKPVPYNPYNLRGGRLGPVVVAAAGPATNILIALVFGLLARLVTGGLLPLPASFLVLTGMVVIINLVLAIFNLLPIPPLDGSKILFSILPYRLARYEELLSLYWPLLIFALIFFFWGIVSRLVFWLAFLFVGKEAFFMTVTQFLRS